MIIAFIMLLKAGVRKKVRQESWATAKMTARCALCIWSELKFVAWLVPERIGGTQKCGQSLDTPKLPLLQNFNGLLFLWMYGPNLKSVTTVALPVPEIIGIKILSRGCEPQSWGRRGRRGSGMVPFERALMISYRHSIVTFSLSIRVSEILPL